MKDFNLSIQRQQDWFAATGELKLIYQGLWYSPLKESLDAFVEKTQLRVTGVVRIKLFKGNAIIVGRRSDNSIYAPDLATYTSEDRFDHKAAEGFIYIWGLPTRVWSEKVRT